MSSTLQDHGSKILIIHHNDLDGRMAGYIAAKHNWNPGLPQAVRVKEMNYDMPVPWDDIDWAEVVVVVDFSLAPLDFQKALLKHKKLIWIDHHKTAIDAVYLSGLDIPGSRADTYPSGAYLTWQFFFPERPVPEVVDIVSKYDTWTHKDDPHILAIKTALDLRDIFAGENQPMMQQLLFGDSGIPSYLSQLEEEGRVVQKAELKMGADRVIENGFWVNFHGRRWWACNGYRVNSLVYEEALRLAPEKFTGAHGWMAFRFTSRMWQVSLYTASLAPEFRDMGEVAKLYGGGGHPRAAGFQAENPPCPCGPNGNWYTPPQRSR